VHPAAALDRMNLDAERALERGDVAGRADHQPVREPVGDAQAARVEMCDDRGLVGLGRRVERVELILREEAMVARRRRILDVREKPFEVLAIAEREPDDDAMSNRRVGAPVIGSRAEQRRQRARQHDVGGSRAHGGAEQKRDDDARQDLPPRRERRAAGAHPFPDSGCAAASSSSARHMRCAIPNLDRTVSADRAPSCAGGQRSGDVGAWPYLLARA
jgi:hypothetical protein